MDTRRVDELFIPDNEVKLPEEDPIFETIDSYIRPICSYEIEHGN